jgi:hypothetical protein
MKLATVKRGARDQRVNSARALHLMTKGEEDERGTMQSAFLAVRFQLLHAPKRNQHFSLSPSMQTLASIHLCRAGLFVISAAAARLGIG